MSTATGASLAQPRVAEAPDRALQWSAAASVLIALILWFGPHLLRADLFDGDAAHHVFWLYGFDDPALFPNDLSIEYFGSRSVAPRGYRWLYAALAPIVDVVLAAKAVAALLFVASAWLVWQIGAAAGSHRGSPVAPLMALFSVLALIVLVPDADLAPRMGFQRAFSMPILLLCVYALVTHRYAWVGVAWLAAALFYPVLLAVLGTFAGIVFLAELIRDRRMPRYWLWNGALGVLALVVVGSGIGVPEGIGPMVTFEEARRMPEFGPEGRQILFERAWTEYWIGHHRTGLLWRPWEWIVWISAALCLAFVLRARDLIPRAVWILAACGIGLWAIAHLTMFDLYLPNRHSRYALGVLAILVLAAAAVAISQRTLRRPSRPQLTTPRMLAFGPPLAVVLALAPQAYGTWTPTWHDLEDAYAFIAELPPATLIAAHPNDADAIPLRTRRSVLVSTETSIAFMQGYYSRLRPRIEASLRATYATSWEQFDAQLLPFGVDAFLVTPAIWDRESYFAPWDDLTEDLIARGRDAGLVLRDPPPGRVLFRSGDVYVVRVGGGPDVAG